MKVLVFSDSHGRKELVDRMLSNEPDCKEVIFLGDGIKDVEWVRQFYPDLRFTVVRGNNDWSYNISSEAYKYFDGVTVYACHGDSLDVRTTLFYLNKKAASVNAKLGLYGHTHVSKTVAEATSGVTAVNPGALCDGKYCVIDFNKGDFSVENKSCW
jgi:putative phosphoesterase